MSMRIHFLLPCKTFFNIGQTHRTISPAPGIDILQFLQQIGNEFPGNDTTCRRTKMRSACQRTVGVNPAQTRHRIQKRACPIPGQFNTDTPCGTPRLPGDPCLTQRHRGTSPVSRKRQQPALPPHPSLHVRITCPTRNEHSSKISLTRARISAGGSNFLRSLRPFFPWFPPPFMHACRSQIKKMRNPRTRKHPGIPP